MLKVVHIGPHPLTVGGTQSVIRTITDFGIGADEISVKPTWNGSHVITNSKLVRRAAGTIMRSAPETIVHVHMSNGGAYLRDGPLIALARACGLRVVVSIHGFDFPQFTAAHPRVVAAILSRAHGILCLSEEAKHAIQQLGINASVERLPNPVAIDAASPPVRDTSRLLSLQARSVSEGRGRAGRGVGAAARPRHARSMPPRRTDRRLHPATARADVD